jgi:hypothetical protein
VADEFKCYQSGMSTHVVHTTDFDDDGVAVAAAVTVSRAVGTPRARALMRLCAAVLNEDGLAAQRELDAMQLDERSDRG